MEVGAGFCTALSAWLSLQCPSAASTVQARVAQETPGPVERWKPARQEFRPGVLPVSPVWAFLP